MTAIEAILAITKEDMPPSQDNVAALVDVVKRHHGFQHRADVWRHIGMTPGQGRAILSGHRECSWPIWYALVGESGLTRQNFTSVNFDDLFLIDTRLDERGTRVREFVFMLTGPTNDNFQQLKLPAEKVVNLAGDIMVSQTLAVPKPMGWYWCHGHPNDAQQVLNGPFESEQAARTAAPDATSFVGHFSRPEIDCDVFDHRKIFEAMNLINVEGIVPGQPVQWPSGAEAEDLERLLAGVLFQFLDARKLWDQFTALVETTPEPQTQGA